MTSTFDFVILYCNLQPPTLPPPTWRRRSESSWISYFEFSFKNNLMHVAQPTRDDLTILENKGFNNFTSQW